MAAEAKTEGRKRGGKGLLFGLVSGVVLGGGAFFATYSGAVPLPFGEATPEPEAHGAAPATPVELVAYIPLDPILVTVGRGETERHLQFAAQIEVEAGAQAAAAALTPRALDVLNTYLRAVAPADVEDPASLMRMRAQMLRRLKVVMGETVVRDLLVSEFILR